MHYPKVLERVDSPEQIFHRSFSLGAPVTVTDKVQGRHNALFICASRLHRKAMQLLSPDAKVISQYHTLIDSLIEFLGCYKELMFMLGLWKVTIVRCSPEMAVG